MTTTRGTLSIGVVALFGTLGLACADHAGVGGVTPADAGNPDVAHAGNPDVANAGNPEVSPAGVITLTITAAATATATGTGTASAEQTATTYSTATAVAAETAPDAGIGTTTAQTSTTTGTGTGTSTPTSVKTVTVTSTSTSTAGVVTSVFPQNGYNLVTIAYPAAWSCPSDTSLPSSITPQGTLPTDPSLSATDCASLANLRRPQLKAQSLTTLTNARASLIRANCTQTTETHCLDSNGLDVSTYNCYYRYGSVDAGMVTPSGGMILAGGSTAMANSGAAGASGATEYSTTNTQVASVDEADYIKNDSNTIFVLSADGLHVVDAWPAAQTHEIAHLTLTGEPRRMYLLDNRLVVYTRVQATSKSGGAGSSNPSDQGCTYGYGCRFSSEGGHTLAVVFDVTNPASPAELVRYEMSGGYVDSRRIGSVVYSVVHDTGATQIPGLDYSLQATSYDDLQTKFNQRVADNNAKIDNTSDAYFLPWSNMTKPGGTATLSSDCQHALVAQNAQGASFVSLNAFDLTKLESPTRTVLGTSPGYVYSSATALYMAVDRTYEQDYASGGYSYSYSYQPTDSFVHKFTLNGTDTSYVGSVTLPGHILNQFAMDENNGVLRVASTKGWVPDTSVASFLTTFGEQSGKLSQLGQIGGIAPQEDIRSVRFDGNRGFVVTFKKTDPLFVFDLTDPAKPQTLGELLIPGFSTYMQPLDTNHMLAIGFTADDQGSFAYFNGIQIQIFDVTDLANPKLAWKTVIGTRGSNSEALTNHLAFNYFAPKKMLALPITVCEGGGNGVYAQNLTFAGLMVFDISLDTGITEHGRLPFLDPATVSASANCGTWWTDSKSLVKRSIFMDDWVYGFSDTQLRVAALANMSSVLQTVPLVSQ
jgi:Secreted protein containing C-terminal beta-propeller domain distantly related to WD-40 repeats